MQIVIDNILYNYEVDGQKNQKTILILHGWGRSLNEWIHTGRYFSKFYKVIYLDLPGFGDSTIPPNKLFGINEYADSVEKFLKKIKANKVILIGHSFGGKIGITLASKSDIVEKLILINSSGVEDKSIKSRILLDILSRTKPLLSILPQHFQERIIVLIASKDYLQSGKLRESFKYIVNQNVSRQATKIKCPTIIIWGEKDKELPISSGKKLRKLINGSIFRVVWNSGHDPHLSSPANFVNLLSEYL